MDGQTPFLEILANPGYYWNKTKVDLRGQYSLKELSDGVNESDLDENASEEEDDTKFFQHLSSKAENTLLVIVCVMLNATKTSPMFTIDERVGMVKRAVVRYSNVRVDTADVLLAEYARRYENAVIVKGLRAASDFDYEFQMNLINKKINPELETMFLTASEKYTFLSSSVVREMATYGADLTGLVPTELIPDIEEKAKLWRKT